MTVTAKPDGLLRLALSGDVMTGRGIDQILPHPCDPRLYEPYVSSALDYVRLAEAANGAIPRRVAPAYIWGDALAELQRFHPAALLFNLETSITTSAAAESKGINYRMNPANIACLTIIGPAVCTLANNHILDWGPDGLRDTLATLDNHELKHAGAGLSLSDAAMPAVLPLYRGGRVLVFAFGLPSSGVARSWAAGRDRPGVNFLPDLSDSSLMTAIEAIEPHRRRGDIVVVSLHWGGNWGYDIPDDQRRFARALIDEAQVDVVYGHSSHHPKAAEIYHDRVILYGCGDFLNDYEGISGYEQFRDDLVLLYELGLDPRTGRVERLDLAPFQIRKFHLSGLVAADRAWLKARLAREFGRFHLSLAEGDGGRFRVIGD